MTFTANGEHLIIDNRKSIQVWRVKDGKQVATMPTESGLIFCVAASNDGRWIAAGMYYGETLVWDAVSCKQVFADETECIIYDIDFSPASSLTHFVSADGENNTATIWDLATGGKVQILYHNLDVQAAKYSPQGDQIATATNESVRVWDSRDGRLLVEVKVPAKSLLRCNNHLFVTTMDQKIRQIDAATGSTVSEWSVPEADSCSFIALPQHGKFIAYTVDNTVTFWDTSTLTQLSPIHHTSDIRSIACSSDGQLFAIADERKIIIKVISSAILPLLSVRFLSCLNPSGHSTHISGATTLY